MNQLLELMYDALRSDVGICISTTDIDRTRAKFYKLRKEEDGLSVLSLRVSPINPNELWIVKNGQAD